MTRRYLLTLDLKDDPALIDEWISKWSDLARFEVVPVLSSDEARRRALGG